MKEGLQESVDLFGRAVLNLFVSFDEKTDCGELATISTSNSLKSHCTLSIYCWLSCSLPACPQLLHSSCFQLLKQITCYCPGVEQGHGHRQAYHGWRQSYFMRIPMWHFSECSMWLCTYNHWKSSEIPLPVVFSYLNTVHVYPYSDLLPII